MMADARTVIARGFSNDARVADPAPPHRAGASTIHASTPTAAYAYFALWCAGFDCGRGKAGDPSHETLLELPRTEDSADTIAGILLDSIMVGIREPPTKLAECWGRYGQGVTDLITEIGRAWNSPKAARKIQYRFERMVLDYDDLSSARALFLTLGVRVDLRRLGALLPANSIDRLYVYLCNGPSVLAVVDIGVLGAVDRDFWITTLTKHFDHFMGRVIRLEIQINKLTKYLPSLVRRSNSGSHQHRLRELRTTMSHQATPLNVRTLGTSKGVGSRGREKTRDGARKSFWEDLFEEEDPWNYGSPYEQEKYERQIEMLPAGKAERALELACAEGHFTSQVAPKVKHLLASDISTRALQRARDRCRGHANVDFIQLDLSTTVLPQEMDLIICSEVLYYLNDEAELVAVTRRLAQALRPGGHLLTAHAFVLKDSMSRSGFDWENPYGAETIARVMESVPDLALEASVQTELYRIDRFRRLHVGEIVSEPVTRVVPIDAPIETEVERFIVRNGAVARRAELAQTERPSQLPILMYHRVASDGPEKLAQLRLSPSAFHAQMLWLRRNGYHTINSEQLAWFVANDHPFVGRPVLITFDDGYKDFAEHAWPILRAHDFSAEVFIVTDLVGGNANWDASYGTPAPLMSAIEIAMLAAEGVSFGSHLASHPRSDELSTRELAEELTRSRAHLEKWLNRSITSFAAPFGCLNQRLRILAAECGFKTGFGTISGAANLKCDLLNLPRIEVRGEWSLDNFVSCMESYQ